MSNLVWFFICILCLLVGGLIVVLTKNKEQFIQIFYNIFKKNNKKFLDELKEKADYQEKEITAELEQRLQEIRVSYSQKEKQIEQEFKNLQSNYGERKAALQHQKDLMIQSSDQDLENYKNIIAKRNLQYQNEIRDLEEQHNQKKDEISVNFQSWRENIDLQKATLSNEIKALEKEKSLLVQQRKQEEELKEKINFYKIELPENSKSDVKKLKEIALTLSKPEVLYKLIYEVYYKAAIEELFKRILGDQKNSGGIYKITDVDNDKVYIGKTTKFLDRWRTHAKRGCNIERISGQLYDVMFQKGIENFTWEIVEICSKDEQSEREKYWIKYFNSDVYGYNMKVG